MTYAITQYPTPVLNRADFSNCFGGSTGDLLSLDESGLLRAIETILFPLCLVELLERIDQSVIWKIRTEEYVAKYPLYIDERFVIRTDKSFSKRQRSLPAVSSIIDSLRQQVGERYIWGGNWPSGIPQLLQWYKPSIEKQLLDALTLETWQLKGVDCSGLLYFASNGCTPRNTSQLVEWGKAVCIADKEVDSITNCLTALDLIVWKGHVVIVLDNKTAIESTVGKGVILTPLNERLHKLCQERKPVDLYTSTHPCFVIRRWC